MFRSLLARLFGRDLDWLQVAVTTHCNASCAYCPHTVYRRHWRSSHLPLSIFHSIIPELKRVRLVYLQGWGEPFLHPDFFTLVSLAKQAGCQVGTTTNATLLTEEVIIRIVESGIDLVAFSLAGVGAANDTWRRGTSYQKVLEAIRSIQACKRRLGKIAPRVHIAYMLLRSGLTDLNKLPGELQGLGIDQVIISTLDLVAAPELEKESLAKVSQSEGRELSHRLEKLADRGARTNLTIYYPDFFERGPKKDCPENVLRAAVVSPAGDVSPCVYTNLPAAVGDYYVKGRPHPIQSLFFGNMQEILFQEIWQQANYRHFRKSWQKGNLFAPCRSCLKII